jgi:hypothetical protein
MSWPLIFCFALSLLACTPTFNWREVSVPDTPLYALLPCKPDTLTREVDMGPPQRPLRLPVQMLGCMTGDTTFAIATAELPPLSPPLSPSMSPSGSALAAQTVLDQWQAANVAALKGASRHDPSTKFAPYTIAGKPAVSAQKLVATSIDAQGQALHSHALYFTQGQRMFYAVILGTRVPPEVDDSFFSGLTFR